MLRASLKFYLSTRRFIVIVILYAIIGSVSPILVAFNVIPNSPDVYSFTTSNFNGISEATLLAVAILAGDALSQDFGRQGLFTLTQPVRRSTIMLARYLAAFLASAVIIFVFFDVFGFALSQYYYGQIVPNAALIVGASLLYVAATVAAVVLFSSIFKSPVVSIVVAFIFFLIVFTFVTGILEFVGVEPWFLISYAGDVVGALGAQTYPQHMSTFSAGPRGGFTITLYTPTFPEAIAIMLGYLVISLFLAWVIYSRKEIKETA
jgi:ABC-2 type transport system permease protein